MDYKLAEESFNNFINDYDMNDDKIKLKYIHTFKVVDISEKLAKKLNLSEEEIELAKIIGLLHDIARFYQAKKYDTFKDVDIDHADYAVKLLFEENMIRKFISDDKYDSIIKHAIEYHNKIRIPNGLDEKANLFCKIIRDADKIDIYRVRTIEYKNEFIEKPTNIVVDIFNEKRAINTSLVKNKSDSLMVLFAFVYDMNFNESFEILHETNILQNFLDSIKISEQNQELFDEIKEKLINLRM